MTQLQEVKGDAAVLLHTGAQLITDEMERLRVQAAADRAEIVSLRERAHASEIRSSTLRERVRTLSGQRHFRDAILALGGLLAGVGFSVWRESPTQQDTTLGIALFVVGLALIAATSVFLGSVETTE